MSESGPNSPGWRALHEQQEAVRKRFRHEGTLRNALMGPWHVRLDALRALAFQHRDAEIVEVALTEQDAPAVMDFALAVALPASPALIEHRLGMRKAKPSMDMAYFYPNGNFLYAETAIMKRVAASPMRLQASVLKGFGLAGLQSAVPLLRKHAALSRLRTRATALAEGDVKAARNEMGGPDYLERQWDGPSERAIEALVALARLGADVDVDQVRALYQQTTEVIPSPSCGGHGAHARNQLAAVLFAAGAMELDEAVAAGADRGELLITLLRRGDENAAHALAAAADFRIMGRHFHVWPALDFATPEFGRHGVMGRIGSDSLYPLSRDAGVAPPPWWQWRSPWTRSDSSRVLRGELTVDG